MNTSNILLIEDDGALAERIYVDLFKAGYQVATAIDLAQGREYLANSMPQALVIDSFACSTGVSATHDLAVHEVSLKENRELTSNTALDFVRELRGRGLTLPIILLLDGDHLLDRLSCLESGADDYLAKPYQASELLKLLGFYLQAIPVSHQKLVFADLMLDLDTRHAVRGQRSIELTAKEFELLRYLMEHPAEILTREQILENVWGYESGGESNVIEVYVRYLRIKLQEAGEKRLIQTVRGLGYVLREN
jgi:two-component system, OmpR family, response regulator NblR